MLKLLRAALVAALFLASPALADDRVKIDVGDSPTRGPSNAPVTLIEFIDFQ